MSVSPASQLCGSQPCRVVQRTSIVGMATLGLSGYDLFRTRRSSNTTLVHRLKTDDRQDSSVQHVKNDLDRDFSSIRKKNRKGVIQILWFLNSRTYFPEHNPNSSASAKHGAKPQSQPHNSTTHGVVHADASQLGITSLRVVTRVRTS